MFGEEGTVIILIKMIVTWSIGTKNINTVILYFRRKNQLSFEDLSMYYDITMRNIDCASLLIDTVDQGRAVTGGSWGRASAEEL